MTIHGHHSKNYFYNWVALNENLAGDKRYLLIANSNLAQLNLNRETPKSQSAKLHFVNKKMCFNHRIINEMTE